MAKWYKEFSPAGLLGFLDDEETPQAPSFEQFIPQWAQGLPPEILNLIRGGVGQQVPTPPEYGISSQALQGMLGMQPQQFQLPIGEIQQALQSQQDIEQQKWQQQMMPLWGAQGQLDSTTRQQQLSDFLQGQASQRYGSTADLLTQQALQNQQMQQWLPQFQAGVAGQLGALGGQQAQLGLQNIQLPFQTTIPALQQQYGTGLQQAGQALQPAMAQWGVNVQQQQQQQQQQAQLMQTLGSLGMGAATGGIGGALGMYGAGVGGGQGALLGLGGYNPGQAQMMQQLGGLGQTSIGTVRTPAQRTQGFQKLPTNWLGQN